jgi:hypothetical protein
MFLRLVTVVLAIWFYAYAVYKAHSTTRFEQQPGCREFAISMDV